jgi:hypothetical protein
MGYRRDRRAPTELTDTERESLKDDASILRLRGELERIKEKLKDSDSCMEEEREALYEQKVELNMELHRTRVALYRDAKRLKRSGLNSQPLQGYGYSPARSSPGLGIPTSRW